jgi:spermidine/putrescine transport system substrate-binding protein
MLPLPNTRSLVGGLAALAVLLSGCAQPTAAVPTQAVAPTQSPTPVAPTPAPTLEPTAAPTGLTVLEWAGYEIPEMWIDFKTAYPDQPVTFNFGASDPDIYAKVLAGSSEDIIHLYTPFLRFYVDEGLIQPIDTSKLTNYDKLPEGFQESCTVDGQVYCVPWDWGYSSIIYRTDKIPEGVDSWESMFDAKYAGHISMWDDGPSAAAVGSYVLGYDETQLTDEQLQEIKEMWVAQRDHNLFYWVDEPSLEEAISAGDVWIAYGWNGAFYRLLQAGVPVAYSNPSQGRNSWIGQYAISAKAKNYDLALAFLDAKLGKETATHLLVDYAYGHPVPEYFSVVQDPLLVQALALDDPQVLERTNFTPPISAADRDRFVQMWAEVKAAP